jgi:hypothetical protein
MDTETNLRRNRSRARTVALLGAMSLLSGDTVAAAPARSLPKFSGPRYSRSIYRPHVGNKQLRKIGQRLAKATGVQLRPYQVEALGLANR